MTDSLIEQVNAAGDEWGYAGMESALATICANGAGPEEIAERLLAACEAFGAGQPPMTRVFVDTSAWYAFINAADPDHQRVAEVLPAAELVS